MNVTGRKKKRITKKLQKQSLWHIPKPDIKVQLGENEIIEVVKKGAIFGLISVDIETPEHLNDYFSEMTPIFKNTLVSRNNVGAHMRDHLQRADRIKRPQRPHLVNTVDHTVGTCKQLSTFTEALWEGYNICTRQILNNDHLTD